MAEIIRYVDPDCGGGTHNGLSWATAYLSLYAWDQAEPNNLVSAGNWHHVYVRSSAGTADTTYVYISSDWTTDSTHYILIEAVAGNEAVKTSWDASRYRLEVTDHFPLDINVGYVYVKGLQIRAIYSSGAYNGIILIEGGTGETRLYNCRMEVGGVASGYFAGIKGYGGTGNTIKVWNCIIDGKGVGLQGVYAYTSNVNIYNSVVCGWAGYALEYRDAILTVRNCAVFDNADDVYDNSGTGSLSLDYCALDDADTQTHPVSETGGGARWTGDFVDGANGNFTLKSTSGLWHAGLANPGSGLYSTDIEGETYNAAAYSVGVDEYIVSGLSIPVVTMFYRRRRDGDLLY
jgi:hypothetical protein